MSFDRHRFFICSATIALSIIYCAVDSIGAIASADHRIMVGDVLDVQVEGEPQLSGAYAVGGDGAIAMPLIGRQVVAELTAPAASEALATALNGRFFKNASVVARIAEYVEGNAQIQGAVANARSVETKGDRPVTLLEAIAMCGGLSSDAAGDQVRIYRWKPGAGFQRDVITVNVREMLEKMDMSNDQYLRPRDLVVVPRVGGGSGGGEFLALGEVRQPGFHPASANLDVIRAITAVGGLSEDARMDAARILRPDKKGQYELVNLNLNRLFGAADMAQNVPVKPGDILFVPSAQSSAGGQVIFLGALNKIGGVPFQSGEGTTLSRAILAQGGFSKFANENKVKVIRTAPDGTKQNVIVDVGDILKTGDFSRDFALREGDVVIVPERSF